MNEYGAFGNGDETHDENGNLTRLRIYKSNGQLDVEWRYEWDALNRMARVTKVKESGQPQPVARYWYYADYRRAAKLVFGQVPGQGQGQPATTLFFYDGWRTIEEQNGAGVTEATYVSGPMYIDEHVAMDRRQGNSNVIKRFYYHANQLFSVHGLTNDQGAVVETVRYDIYGDPHFNAPNPEYKQRPLVDEPPASKTSPHGNPLLFTGHRWDTEVGLWWIRFRSYDSVRGRFLARDILGYRDGMNLYSYGAAAPATFLDPSGLELRISAGQAQGEDASAIAANLAEYLQSICAAATVGADGQVSVGDFGDLTTQAGCCCLRNLVNSPHSTRVVGQRMTAPAQGPGTTPTGAGGFSQTQGGVTSPGSGTGSTVRAPVEGGGTTWTFLDEEGNVRDAPNWRVLAHELCGHALPLAQGRHATTPPGHTGQAGDRPEHDQAIAAENEIAAEHPGQVPRGQFGDPGHGESGTKPAGPR